MQEQIERDLKSAMLAGDKSTAETLRGLKSAILYEAVALNARDSGLSEEQIQKVLAREAKKRTDAAKLYKDNGAGDRAEIELGEREIIERYLPQQMSEEEVGRIVEEEVAKISDPSVKDMGHIIGAVRNRTQGQADGSLIAKLVKDRLVQ